jgi:5'-3' exonuclease
MGDTADNIGGLKKGGKKLAYELLSPFNDAPLKDESAIAELVLRRYMAIDQNPWPEAVALWLYRSETYDFGAHLNTLNLSRELKVWLHEKLKEPWYADDWRTHSETDTELVGLPEWDGED